MLMSIKFEKITTLHQRYFISHISLKLISSKSKEFLFILNVLYFDVSKYHDKCSLLSPKLDMSLVERFSFV